MKLPAPRGPLSQRVLLALQDGPAAVDLDSDELHSGWQRSAAAGGLAADADAQLALWVLYELHYRGFEGTDPALEWSPELIRLRLRLEEAFEAELRLRTDADVDAALEGNRSLVDQLLGLIEAMDGGNLASYLQRDADLAQIREFLRLRSIYHLKESDPQAFQIARLDGPAKVALAELQYDEFGGGRPERLHARLYADALRAAELDDGYGAYIDEVTPLTLAVNNVMSLFGLHRRLRGASLGHLAAFEATSSVPCRRIAAGIERVGLPDEVAAYFHEHVEADAVHEEVAVRDICGNLVADEPELARDVLFGAAACLALDALAGQELVDRWQPSERVLTGAAS
ncbi:iron-containing redox enzyme family protein [Nocardioides pacificus]